MPSEIIGDDSKDATEDDSGMPPRMEGLRIF
jgi:hypothetical protein